MGFHGQGEQVHLLLARVTRDGALAVVLLTACSQILNVTQNAMHEASTVESDQSIGEAVAPQTEEGSIEIRLRVGDVVVRTTLVDSETTRDFVSLLPLMLTLEDYAGIEKISQLPKRLSTEGVPEGSDPSVGDITHYAPLRKLANFHRDSGFSSGLVILGKIDRDIGVLTNSETIDVTIELVNTP